jgi:hypothetical protein
MIITIPVIKDIFDVAQTLFGLGGELVKAKTERRDKMADYFMKVSECLAATYDSLTANNIPHGRCAELAVYAELLPQVVKGLIDDSKAQELSLLLKRSHMVEGLWEALNSDPKKGNELPKIAEASGLFLALSNSLRAGFIP